MVKQYPAILNCTKSGESTMVNGNPVPGATVELSYKCRYRPNTSAKTIKNVDGQVIVYRGTCYVPKPNVELVTGDKVIVPGFVDEAIVLQVYSAQMRTRIIL